MGHRAIGALEKEDGLYDAHYTHWLPLDDFESNFSEEKPLGEIFRKNPVAEDISLEEAKSVARNRGASVVIKIDKNYDVEIIPTRDI